VVNRSIMQFLDRSDYQYPLCRPNLTYPLGQKQKRPPRGSVGGPVVRERLMLLIEAVQSSAGAVSRCRDRQSGHAHLARVLAFIEVLVPLRARVRVVFVRVDEVPKS